MSSCPKKIRKFFKKDLLWIPVLLTAYKFTEAELRHKCFPLGFRIIFKQVISRPHVNICLWLLGAILIFDKETLLNSLSELTTLNFKEQLLRKYPGKGAYQNFLLRKALRSTTMKRVFWGISQNSQENICAGVFFLVNVMYSL